MQQTVIIGSANPVKVASVSAAFQKCFPKRDFAYKGLSTASGVADQPIGDEETLRGAQNRAYFCREAQPDADFWVGIEGGIGDEQGQMDAFAWMVVLGKQRQGKARTANFYLPEAVAQLVRAGVELGHADDQVFGRSNSKQSNGAVGLLTRDLLGRTAYYEHALILALIPFMQPELYPAQNT